MGVVGSLTAGSMTEVIPIPATSLLPG